MKAQDSLSDKRLMDLARSGDFEATVAFIHKRRYDTMKNLVGDLHPADDYSYEQFDVYADAMRTVRDVGELWGAASTS